MKECFKEFLEFEGKNETLLTFYIIFALFSWWTFNFHGTMIFLNTVSWFAFGYTLIFVEGTEF